MINITIAITLLAAYTITLCVINRQIPKSLSASVFFLPKTEQWLWTAVIVAVTLLTAPTIIEKSSTNTQFLAFIACASLLFVGGAPLIKDKRDMAYKVHMAGAATCAISSQILLIFNQPWLILCWVFWIGDYIVNRKQWGTKVFWAEMVCFTNTFSFCLV